jgi:hypothetical protein
MSHGRPVYLSQETGVLPGKFDLNWTFAEAGNMDTEVNPMYDEITAESLLREGAARGAGTSAQRASSRTGTIFALIQS